MGFFGSNEEIVKEVVKVPLPHNWIKVEYTDIFNPVHKIVRNWPSGLTVSDMTTEIDRAKKNTKSRKKEEIYYAMLASLYRMIYVERGSGAFITEDDLDPRKKAIFMFVYQIVKDVDIKNTKLSSLVLRMAMDFIEFYKVIIEEYDKRVFKNKPNEKIFTKLMNVIQKKHGELTQRSDIENKLEQQAQILRSTS